VLYVAPTDGSKAGTLTPVAGFPTGTTVMGTPHVLPNGTVTVFAGSSASALDLYLYDPVANTLKNLTNKGDINVNWTLLSDNGQYLYFDRDFTSSTTSNANDIVAITPTGTLKDITGSEFSSGSAPSLEL